jgi:mRNA interferase RelE/StbE
VASYNLLIKPSAVKELERLPVKARRLIVRKIESLSADPRPRGSEKFSGKDLHRVRQGDYRILYDVQDKARVVVVIGIGHRREVYL